MRLDKYLSHATGLTRSEVKTAVKQKRVKVNDKLVLKSDFFIDPNTDIVADRRSIDRRCRCIP